MSSLKYPPVVLAAMLDPDSALLPSIFCGTKCMWYIVQEISICISVRHKEVLLFRRYMLHISVVLTILEDLNRWLLFNISF